MSVGMGDVTKNRGNPVHALCLLCPPPPPLAVLRDTVDRGRDLEAVLHQYTEYVKPAFEDFTWPVRFGDVCFVVWNGRLCVSLSVFVLVQYARSLSVFVLVQYARSLLGMVIVLLASISLVVSHQCLFGFVSRLWFSCVLSATTDQEICWRHSTAWRGE